MAHRAPRAARIAICHRQSNAIEVIDAWRDAGRSLAIVSNNSAAAVQTYLSANAIRVAARTDRDAALLKPSPHLVTRVLVWRVRLRR